MKMLNKRAATALILALGMTLTPAHADQFSTNSKAVVELFTSQGCAQCPPADALLAELGENADVIPLAYHVDYWDFMGWPDSFGSRANSDRQRAYNRRWGTARIFTPQMVINGHQGLIGSREAEVRRAIASTQLSLPISLTRLGETLEVSIPPAPGLRDASVWAISFIPSVITPIAAGENKGHSLPYHYVVTERQLLGEWTAEDGAHFAVPLKQTGPDLGIAILLQDDHNDLPGTILAAASYRP